MNKKYKNLLIPYDAYKEIMWYLYNYNSLDQKIKERKEELENKYSNYYNFSGKNYFLSLNGNGYTLEDCVVNKNCDNKIYKYEKWKDIINEFLIDSLKENDDLPVKIVRLKFWEKLNNNEVIKYLDINEEDLKSEIFFIFYDLYLLAKRENIIRG